MQPVMQDLEPYELYFGLWLIYLLNIGNLSSSLPYYPAGTSKIFILLPLVSQGNPFAKFQRSRSNKITFELGFDQSIRTSLFDIFLGALTLDRFERVPQKNPYFPPFWGSHKLCSKVVLMIVYYDISNQSSINYLTE